MTRKLEDLFDLPSSVEIETENEIPNIAETRAQLAVIDDAIDKIDSALPAVRDLDASDGEMDELADLAKDSYKDLMDLGMQVDSRFASEIFNVAGTMLGHAITAKTAKMNKKLKVIDLQLKKMRLDQQTPEEQQLATAQGQVLNRNDLLERLLKGKDQNNGKYLAESERTYQYRIKVVGDIPPGFFKSFEEKLDQFDVVKMSTPKSTPVRAVIPDFPAFPNQSVTRVDVEFKYPAIEPQIKQIARLLGLDENRIVMMTTPYEESLDVESAKITDQNKDLLDDPDYPADDKMQKNLKKDYSADPYNHVVLKNAYRSNFTVAGGKTPPAKTTNDLPMGTTSPMTNIKRQPKPATGAKPRG